ncbi:MAG TPA: hypothetical protein VGB85_20155, partial [Nannocystis sp.]
GTVTQQDRSVQTWEPYLAWQPQAALQRAQSHPPSPLDLPNELQEEVVLPADWTCQEDTARATPERRVFTVAAHGLELDAVVPAGADGSTLAKFFEKRVKRGIDPKRADAKLYGLVHYELGRLVLSPLATLTAKGPEHLMLTGEKINLQALLGSLHL